MRILHAGRRSLATPVVVLAMVLVGCPSGVARPLAPADLAPGLELPAGQGPFPAVVLLHGCNGVGRLYIQWAARLRSWGYATLIVDSFKPRGVRSKCGHPTQGPGRLRDRVQDAYAALRYLRGRPDVQPAHIALMGWSMGGTTTLLAMWSRVAGLEPPGEGFRAAIAFYPGCFDAAGYRAPLLILIGRRDDWASAERCQRLAEGRPAGNERVALVVYPNAYHAFDAERAHGVYLGHTLQYDPQATADAIVRVRRFLARHLGGR